MGHKDTDGVLDAFEEGSIETIKYKIKKGIPLSDREKAILQAKEFTIDGHFSPSDGAVEGFIDIAEDTLNPKIQAGGMQTGFTKDWTGVYKPILTVFNGGKRKPRKGKNRKTRKSKARKGRKGTRRH